MSSAIVVAFGSYMRDPRVSTNVSTHVAHLVATELGCPVLSIHGPRFADDRWNERVDLEPRYDWAFLVGNHAFSNNEFRDLAASVFCAARFRVYLQNDYTLRIMPRVKRALEARGQGGAWLTWTTIPRALRRSDDAYVNWNAVAYGPLPHVPRYADRREALFYFGACRPGRVEAFRRYLTAPRVKTIVSTPLKSRPKFEAFVGRDVELRTAKRDGSLVADLAKHRASLLIEDGFSLRNYTSPPTRFYECLSAGTAMLVDRRVVSLPRAGYALDGCAVDSAADVARVWPRVEELADTQRRRWRRDHRGELQQQLRELVRQTEAIGGCR